MHLEKTVTWIFQTFFFNETFAIDWQVNTDSS